MKKFVINVLKKALKEKEVKLTYDEIEKILETPPSPEMGDYAFPCFFLSEKLKEEPHEIAIEIRKKIGNLPISDFDDIQTSGAYINFFLNRKEIARKAVWEIITQKEKFGKINLGKRKKVLVEFSDPNIAKPFGIGHLRSTIIGNSIANIYEFMGFKVIRINYLGDWGTQFGKLLLGYEKFGNEKKLEKDPLKHLLEIYIKVNKKIYEKQAKELFKKLEDGDKKLLMLWKIFKEISIEELEKTYKMLGVNFDVYSGESLSIKNVDKVVRALKEKKLLKKSDGALIVNLEEHGLGICVIKKSDEATTYMLRDLATAIERYKKYKFKEMIYEVGQEQKLYFKQLFKILELMGYEWAKNCIHVEHGLYLDKNGKKFSTRKGKTIFLEKIINKTISLAEKEIKKRNKKILKEDLKERTLKIAIAAVFYGDLKNNRRNNIVFDIKKFVSFEGDTGPYLQYSYARASSILKKAKNDDKFEIYDLESKEIELAKKLLEFREVVLTSYKNLSPSLIANYSHQLAQIFNEFYHSCQVIGSKQESFRLALVEAFRQILRESLKLLGIKTLEKM
jgi:arginyl-tRNA synthetase